jgi:hypothetical protein
MTGADRVMTMVKVDEGRRVGVWMKRTDSNPAFKNKK